MRSARSATPVLPTGIIHGDLFRDNVLWQLPDRSPLGEAAARSTIAALLDFESAHLGPFVYDIAVTLLSWAYGSDLDPAIARAIVAGYEERRPLAAIERDALYDETRLATLRFTITRITDDAIRVGKRWQRFVERREAVERLGPAGLAEVVGW
ncbi:MAG: phosphotransferase [Rubrivivax sp.]